MSSAPVRSTKLKAPTPVKKPTGPGTATSAATTVARNLKRRSIDIVRNKPPAKKAALPPSRYGQFSQTDGGARVLSSINSSAGSGAETFRRGVLPKTQQRMTGRPTNIVASATCGRTPSIVTRPRSSTSSRQSDAAWKDEMAARIKALETEKLEKQTTVSEKDLEIARLESENERLEATKTRLQNETEALKNALSQATSQEVLLKSKISALETQLTNWQERAMNLEEGNRLLTNEREELRIRCRQNETMFRKLHNDIVDLKGNIRVIVRMRPVLQGEPDFGQLPTHVQFIDKQKLSIQIGKNSTQHEFQRVFAPRDTQAIVFDELGEFIQSALHGFNVTILAFGQTGSGKTFTMQGGSSEATMGIIPRAVRLIFTAKKELTELGWKYDLSVSFLEIYNEECRDLLVEGKDKLDIKVGSGQVKIPQLTEHPVLDANEVFRLLARADAKRSVGATKCNSQSSRSHAIFKLNIEGTNETSGEKCSATLNLVDLAGSERLKESGAEGERLVETQHINGALSNLQNVIRTQWKKTGHVPYRNSKLTMVLQDALGAGNSKTLMIVNVSPLADSAEETRRSLEFAAQTSNTNIGAAKKV